MYLGNIVSEEKLVEIPIFNYSSDLSNIDIKIPTLIIGWDLCKRLFKDKKLSILDKVINENISWTFTKKERRIDFEIDIENFIKKIFKNIKTHLEYEYINILTINFNKIKNIIKELTSQKKFYIYIHNNSFIYAYFNNKVIGVDFNMIDFLNIDRKKIYKILYPNNEVIFSDENLPKIIRENIDNNYKIIPYLYAIQNDKKQY